MTLFLEIIGWVGNICFFLGAILTAKKSKWLFLCQILGNVFYVLQAGLMHNFSLLFLSIVLIGINIWGWMAWNPKNTAVENKICGISDFAITKYALTSAEVQKIQRLVQKYSCSLQNAIDYTLLEREHNEA